MLESPPNVLGVDRLRAVRDAAPHRRWVMTTGCFDLLHAGHVAFLAESRAQGDMLMVGVNSDRAVKILKGRGRPLVGEGERTALIAALRAVDYVFAFDDVVADRWIRRLRPDVLAIGEEASAEYPSEIAAAREAGARLHVIRRIPRLSTTALVEDVLRHADVERN